MPNYFRFCVLISKLRPYFLFFRLDKDVKEVDSFDTKKVKSSNPNEFQWQKSLSKNISKVSKGFFTASRYLNNLSETGDDELRNSKML